MEDDRGGMNTLFRVGTPAALGALGNISGGAGAELTDPARHFVDVGLRAGGNDPTLDSEKGHLMLLRIAKAV